MAFVINTASYERVAFALGLASAAATVKDVRILFGNAGVTRPAVAYIDHQIKVEPLKRVYARPKFTAKAIVTANAILKIARRVPTRFPEGC